MKLGRRSTRRPFLPPFPQHGVNPHCLRLANICRKNQLSPELASRESLRLGDNLREGRILSVAEVERAVAKSYSDYQCTRVIDVSNALDCGRNGLMIWNLRGHTQPLEEFVNFIVCASTNHEIGAIILDPVYKVLGDRCENANEDVADLLNYVDEIAESTGAAFVFAHHFAKGPQGGKFVEDAADTESKLTS